jgi:hypothetical protein
LARLSASLSGLPAGVEAKPHCGPIAKAARVKDRAANSGTKPPPRHYFRSFRLRAGIAMTQTATRQSTRRKSARQRPAKSTRRSSGRRWSARVTKESDALDLKGGVFKLRDPKRIAASLKRSAERSHRRKSNPYRSALSMLTFYINRAGKNLPASRRKTLQRAKAELRKQFGRDE